MAQEYNVPWKIEGEFLVTGNGKIHKDDIQGIINQRDHEVNNLRCINQMMSHKINRLKIPTTKLRVRRNFLNKYLSVFN